MIHRIELPSGRGALLIGGTQGWCQWDVDPSVDVRVRLVQLSLGAEQVRLQIAAIAVGSLGASHSDVRVTGDLLRQLPVGELERTVNDPDVAVSVADALSQRDSADLRPARRRIVQGDEAHAVENLKLFELASKDELLRLEVPEGAKSDAFYADVLAKFEWASGWSRGPARELALANKRPVTTVHRWIREAKRRAAMPTLFEG